MQGGLFDRFGKLHHNYKIGIHTICESMRVFPIRVGNLVIQWISLIKVSWSLV